MFHVEQCCFNLLCKLICSKFVVFAVYFVWCIRILTSSLGSVRGLSTFYLLPSIFYLLPSHQYQQHAHIVRADTRYSAGVAYRTRLDTC